MKPTLLALIAASSLTSLPTFALQLHSQDIQEGQPMRAEFEFQGFGCAGKNHSPQLSWSGAPKGTKSFAVTAYDPDAPTGSGWWHWSAVDIPAKVTVLAKGADLGKLGAVELRNDYGHPGFGGVCPPQGHGMHRYQFTVWALPVETLDLPESASPALAGYMLNSMALDQATLTATYSR
ncbi:YbhB/YbcL family Raf kinase inhibitor-like protein [Vibrio proteolyticus]|uniref:YbhB/YbcL family Raf kinase inhibitor-like protein n=1 Tax=Vibrio proteolyticus NBRC 13287 TaxID=1219065 RepID=U3BF14_VIBPR|nr:YbhB/YbcL family Raf kinase inhibitor-like protein [Vibrio proteolyticus]GAD68299.1 hypothetical protein VPR01S_12_01080 [Vibrio proteolyticus NBRC 13287]